MHRFLLGAILFCLSHTAFSQGNHAVVDSFRKKLSSAKTPASRVEIMGYLCRVLMNSNIAEADSFGRAVIEEAENSRDRKLMVKAQMVNGERMTYGSANKGNLDKAISYYSTALELARKNKLEKERAESLIALAGVHNSLSNKETAFSLINEDSSIAGDVKDDSLTVAVYSRYGQIYQSRKENILALRNYLNALRIAEKLKKPKILRLCYINLRKFYQETELYDKAIDYAHKAIEELEKTTDGNVQFNKAVDLVDIGYLYLWSKDFHMSKVYFEKSMKLSDSLKYPPLKNYAVSGLLNQHLYSEKPKEALEFFNSSPELKAFLKSFGLSHVEDQAYAAIYTELKNFDSAGYYFRKALPAYNASAIPTAKMAFYSQYAKYLMDSKQTESAIHMYDSILNIANSTGNLEWQKQATRVLDSLYNVEGNFEKSYAYSKLYQKYKDSISSLGEEKELLVMEIADEQARQKLLEEEKAEALRKKHNVQYMGITMGIAVAFLFLILLGIFQVSATTIKVMGFFSFIFLFEFIILIADTQIHHMTHGEPLPILGIKIVLIAMLLPLHHWLEHRVVHYLASRRLILPVKSNVWNRIRTKVFGSRKDTAIPL